jgi:hypothetical protein
MNRVLNKETNVGHIANWENRTHAIIQQYVHHIISYQFISLISCHCHACYTACQQRQSVVEKIVPFVLNVVAVEIEIQ